MLTLKGHSSGICSVTFSPDGKRIATGSQDHAAKVWDAATGKELLSLKGHTDWVIPVAFSPDGQQIVTGSRDTTARLWMAATGEQVSTWQKEEMEAQERVAVLGRKQVAAAERERALRAQDPGAIKQWLVLAPIAFAGRKEEALKALDQEQIAQEANLHPRAGERVKVGESELVWKVLRADDSLVDFNRFLQKETQWSVAYAVAYIQSEVERTGLMMKVGTTTRPSSISMGKAFIGTRTSGPVCWTRM
jgi:hypothetical protein